MNKQVWKLLAQVAFDGLLACLVMAVSLLCLPQGEPFADPMRFISTVLIYAAVVLVVFFLCRLQAVIWRFASVIDWCKVILASLVASVLFFVLMTVIKWELSTDLYIFSCFVMTLLALAYRWVLRMGVLARAHKKTPEKSVISGNVMLIGAGSAGSLLLHDIISNHHFKGCKVVCAIDDSPEKYHQYICGVRVEGNRYNIVSLAKKFKVDTIVFAIPTCPKRDRTEILNLCQKTGCHVCTMPGIHQLLDESSVNVHNVRDVRIEDLLGRAPIDIHADSVMGYVENQTVMVTGGGGSIGSELCRQIACHNPKRLIIFDIYENNAYDIQNELRWNHPDLDIVTLIGSVRDSKRLNHVFEDYHPDVVFHAAAHKHVPLMEDSPNEAIKNNVFGTLKMVQTADRYKVKKFVLISTDKAVNPTNIMGASKRICEMIMQSYAGRSKTEFAAVRFGNVLGSNGSVIPLFKKQIESGGPVTVTDPNIIRYFMTIPEAVSLVLKAGANAKGGEIFVLDMGEPVRIVDLAENMIRLSGYTPHEDISIVFTGLRPGEKMYEELLMSEEGLRSTENPLIYIGHTLEFDETEFFNTLEKMRDCMYDDQADVRELVKAVVPTYTYKADAKVSK